MDEHLANEAADGGAWQRFTRSGRLRMIAGQLRVRNTRRWLFITLVLLFLTVLASHKAAGSMAELAAPRGSVKVQTPVEATPERRLQLPFTLADQPR